MSLMTKLKQRVESYLVRMDLSSTASEPGLYTFKFGSTVVVISLFEQNDQTFCRFGSILLKDFEPVPELPATLMQLNTEVLFGGFLLFDDTTLSFAATILGNNLDFEEFETTINYVAKISDDYDEILQEMAGGKRAEDVFGDI